MKINKWILLLFSVFLLFSYVQYNRAKVANATLLRLKLSQDSVITLKDSSVALLARTQLDKDSLSSALKVAKELNGTLIAAANIRLTPKNDTRTHTNETVTTIEGTRELHISDTLTAGILQGTIKAPPPPQELTFKYDFFAFPIIATVSLISINDTLAVFSVKYKDGEAKVTHAFARIPPKEKVLTGYGEALYSITGDRNFALRTGLIVRTPLKKWNLVAQAEHLFGSKLSFAGAGLRYVF